MRPSTVKLFHNILRIKRFLFSFDRCPIFFSFSIQDEIQKIPKKGQKWWRREYMPIPCLRKRKNPLRHSDSVYITRFLQKICQHFYATCPIKKWPYKDGHDTGGVKLSIFKGDCFSKWPKIMSKTQSFSTITLNQIYDRIPSSSWQLFHTILHIKRFFFFFWLSK